MDCQWYFWLETVGNDELERIVRTSFDAVIGLCQDTEGRQPDRGLHAGD